MSAARHLAVREPGGRSPAGGHGGQLLVPVDDAARSRDAVSAAVRLVVPLDGLLRIVHVRTWDPAGAMGIGRFCYETSAEATQVLEQTLTGAWNQAVRASGLVVDAPRPRIGSAIAAQAREWAADAIVLSRRPRHAIGVLLLGSVTDQVMREATCPVLIIRRGRR
jgi:nucleotide-binding universal stress UspA family protein